MRTTYSTDVWTPNRLRRRGCNGRTMTMYDQQAYARARTADAHERAALRRRIAPARRATRPPQRMLDRAFRLAGCGRLTDQGAVAPTSLATRLRPHGAALVCLIAPDAKRTPCDHDDDPGRRIHTGGAAAGST